MWHIVVLKLANCIRVAIAYHARACRHVFVATNWWLCHNRFCFFDFDLKKRTVWKVPFSVWRSCFLGGKWKRLSLRIDCLEHLSIGLIYRITVISDWSARALDPMSQSCIRLVRRWSISIWKAHTRKWKNRFSISLLNVYFYSMIKFNTKGKRQYSWIDWLIFMWIVFICIT